MRGDLIEDRKFKWQDIMTLNSNSEPHGQDRTIVGFPYCPDGDSHQAMEDLNSEFIRSYRHQYSPNLDLVEDPEAEMYWLQMADFYEWPHIQYFDDLQHLKALLNATDFLAIHNAMKREMRIRESKVRKSVCEILNRVSRRISK